MTRMIYVHGVCVPHARQRKEGVIDDGGEECGRVDDCQIVFFAMGE